jgi:hypothetical protein
MTSCSFRWKNTRPRKMALLASSVPQDPGNEAVLVQVAPLVFSRVVCPRSRDVSSSLVCNKDLFVLACLLCACCVLTGRSRPCLFKEKIRYNPLKHHIKLDLLENSLLYRWFPGALSGPTKAPADRTLKVRKPIGGSVFTTRKLTKMKMEERTWSCHRHPLPLT